MRRGTFLKRGVGGVVGLGLLGRLPPTAPGAVPLPPVVPAPTPINVAMEMVASGGICAPVTPFYNMNWAEISPVADAIPSFKASRGEIRLD